MPDWNDPDAWDDPDESRDVDARRWRPTHVVERALGIDEYRSVVARVAGIETGPAPDLMVDIVAVGTLLLFVLLVLAARALVG
ncbi:MAG: hypothetical protein ABEH40_04835 [Haloferacaceae archaeon]